MKAAHPTIFLHLAKEVGIETPTLQRLLDDRDTFLNENDVTKNDLNKMLNQDKPKNLHTSDLKELANEFLKVKEMLYIKYKDTIKPKEKRYNIKSSVVNHLLCIHENILLQRVVKKYGKHIRTLCFDGFLFDKNIPIEISSLNELTKDYGVVWAQKPMSENLTVPDDFVALPTYEEAKAKFELNHAICLDPPCFIKKTPYSDLMMKKSDFMDAVACEEVPGIEKKPIFDFNQWIKDPSRRAYNKIDFNPFHDNEEDPTPDDVYNSFRPFAAKYVKKEDRHKDTGAFRDHLKTNMCNDDEVGSDWLYKLFAWRFQNPNKLPEVGVVLKGLQGSGKDRLMDIMTRIMGSSNDYIHRTEEVGDLFGKFTPALKHKLFVQLNEMEGKAGCDNKEKLKGAITKDVNYINEKNLKPYYLRNLALIIVCSNNLTPVQIPYDCRRWVVYQTGRKNIGNMPFWEWFSALISDDHWIDSVYSELIDDDLTGWRPDDLRLQPKTEAYIAAQEDNIPSLYKYLREIDWDDPSHFTKYEGTSKNLCGKHFVDGKEMWNNVKNWIEDEGLREIKGGTQSMNKMLREIEGIEISKQCEKSTGDRNASPCWTAKQ